MSYRGVYIAQMDISILSKTAEANSSHIYTKIIPEGFSQLTPSVASERRRQQIIIFVEATRPSN